MLIHSTDYLLHSSCILLPSLVSPSLLLSASRSLISWAFLTPGLHAYLYCQPASWLLGISGCCHGVSSLPLGSITSHIHHLDTQQVYVDDNSITQLFPGFTSENEVIPKTILHSQQAVHTLNTSHTESKHNIMFSCSYVS